LPEEKFEMLNHGENNSTGVTPDGFTYEMPFNNYQVSFLNNFPFSAVGKLFFVIPPGASEPAGDYVCSGSVMNNNYTVLTARHCMFDYATGIWYNSWVFDPAYNSGPNSKYGSSWTPNRLITWTSGASTYDYDIGLMQMHDASGTGCNGSSGSGTIGSLTGHLGSAWGGNYSQRQWDIFGYPQGSPFNGNTMFQDEGATGVLNPFGTTNVIQVGNPQTGGTSGGPWVLGLDPKGATDPAPSNNITNSHNLANGLNSFQWTSPAQPLAINGPAFMTYNFQNLVTSYKALSCP
jgi:V8-like Glu-specific endopeptidase